jgi:hypothetical protein
VRDVRPCFFDSKFKVQDSKVLVIASHHPGDLSTIARRATVEAIPVPVKAA